MPKVVLTADAATQYDELPRTIRARVLRVLERLERWPIVSGAKPLKGTLAGHYRIRTGGYRVQFEPGVEQVMVGKIGHRDGFYEE
jgi:mRNA-degrading endonuclease RelE of RelBE toxin-antitoxin system